MLPNKWGLLKVIGFPSVPTINKGLTYKLKKPVYNSNAHSDGHRFMVRYIRKGEKGFFRKIRNFRGLTFKPSQPLGKQLSVKIMEDPYFFRRVQ